MVGMAFTKVHNTKVIDDELEENWAPFLAPESIRCGGFIVTRFVEAYEDKILCQFSTLCQAVATSKNFEIDPSMAGVSSEVELLNELLRDVRDLEAHILRTIHGRSLVEVSYVKINKPCIVL